MTHHHINFHLSLFLPCSLCLIIFILVFVALITIHHPYLNLRVRYPSTFSKFIDPAIGGFDSSAIFNFHCLVCFMHTSNRTTSLPYYYSNSTATPQAPVNLQLFYIMITLIQVAFTQTHWQTG